MVEDTVDVCGFKVDMGSDRWTAFFEFVEERACILAKKCLGALKPWTTDPILAAGKFGNVWRDMDRGTMWEIDALLGLAGCDGSPQIIREQQVQLILTYRHNIMPWVTDALIRGMMPTDIVRMANGRAIMHDAIKIWPHFFTPGGEGSWTAPTRLEDASPLAWAEYVCQHRQDVLKVTWDTIRSWPSRDPHTVMAELQVRLPRLGEFKAYECVTSMTYLDWLPWTENSLVHVGHGSLPALRTLTGITQDMVKDEHMSCVLAALTEKVHGRLLHRDKMSWYRYHKLRLLRSPKPVTPFSSRTLEDCLCEFRKYQAVKNGTRENRPYPDNLGR